MKIGSIVDLSQGAGEPRARRTTYKRITELEARIAALEGLAKELLTDREAARDFIIHGDCPSCDRWGQEEHEAECLVNALLAPQTAPK